jgi:hypothetical protein
MLHFIGVKFEIGQEDDNGGTDGLSDNKMVDDFDTIYDTSGLLTGPDEVMCGDKRTDISPLTPSPAKRLKTIDNSSMARTSNANSVDPVDLDAMNVDLEELNDRLNATVAIEEPVQGNIWNANTKKPMQTPGESVSSTSNTNTAVHGNSSTALNTQPEPSPIVSLAVPFKIVNPLMSL